MREDTFHCNGVRIVFGLSLVTEPGEGWSGQQIIGTFHTPEALSEAINSLKVPPYWQIKVEAVEHPSNYSEYFGEDE